MPLVVTERPSPADHAPYYSNYIDLVPPGDLVTIMHNQIAMLSALLLPLSDTQASFSYAPGKWTIRDVVGHLTDTERVFSYRATAFSRADPGALPGFDQAAWTPLGEYHTRTMADLLAEWATARDASLALLRAMPRAAFERSGIASGNRATVLSLLTILPGHVEYHRRTLQRDYHSALP